MATKRKASMTDINELMVEGLMDRELNPAHRAMFAREVRANLRFVHILRKEAGADIGPDLSAFAGLDKVRA